MSLRSWEGAAADLAVYAPGEHQAWHTHEIPSVSVLLWGAVREATARADVVSDIGSVCLKNPSLPHSNVYGPEGAGLLSIKVTDCELWTSVHIPEPAGWCALDQSSMGALLRLILRPCSQPKDILDDVVALAAPMPRNDQPPPPWLVGVRDRLTHEPDSATILQLASEYGVHRVHLARSFASWFGEAPSVYRHRRMTARGLRSALADGAPAAIAASEAGFADQSHMARAVRRQTGHSMTQLKHLLRQVSSVQE